MPRRDRLMRVGISWWVAHCAFVFALPIAARAHAPIPATLAVMPSEDGMIVGLNVGLLVESPEASTWSLTCGPDASGDVLGYRADPSRKGRVLALRHAAVAVTDDLGCSWTQWPLGDGELLDAGFAGERIWALVGRWEGAVLEIWDSAAPEVRRSSRLPPGLEIINALPLAEGREGATRFFVSAYDSGAGSAYLLETDGNATTWRTHAVTQGTFELPKLMHATSGSNELVLRLMGSDDERVAWSRDGQSFGFSPAVGGFVRALVDDDRAGLLLGLSSEDRALLLELGRDGMPLASRAVPFAIRELAGTREQLFALNAMLDRSPLLYESADLGATWQPILSLSEVTRHDCGPAAAGCEVSCAQLALLGLLHYERCTASTQEMLRPPVAAERKVPAQAGCSTAAGARTAEHWLYAAAALAFHACRRRRR